MSRTAFAALLLLLGVGGAYAAETIGSPAARATATASGTAPPKVIQLSYSQSSEGGSSLLAFARRTDSLKFSTRYRGEKARAPARKSSVSDTNLKGQARRGWEPIRKQGGKRVKALVRDSLDARGVATVRTRAKRDGQIDSHRWRIVQAKCDQDPPLFPLDCEIGRGGKHSR